MADDPDLHLLFRSLDEATDAAPIDAKKVIARSRRRRLPAQIAIGTGATLAIAALFLGIGTGVRGLLDTSTTSSSVGSAERAPESVKGGDDATGTAAADSSATADGVKRAPAEKINLCGGAVAEVAPSETGLVLTPHFPDAAAGAASVEGTVTLTNTGTRAWTGTTTSAPAITLARDGITVWHTDSVDSAERTVDLAPGESIDYDATLEPVVCGVEDDLGDAFRKDLPAATPGEYQVSAAIDFVAESDAKLITGPAQTIALK